MISTINTLESKMSDMCLSFAFFNLINLTDAIHWLLRVLLWFPLTPLMRFIAINTDAFASRPSEQVPARVQPADTCVPALKEVRLHRPWWIQIFASVLDVHREGEEVTAKLRKASGHWEMWLQRGDIWGCHQRIVEMWQMGKSTTTTDESKNTVYLVLLGP